MQGHSVEHVDMRERLLNSQLTFGSWIQIGHAASAELLALAGFEWLVVDCEHTDIDLEIFTALARAMSAHGATAIVRVRENDTLAIRQALDAGAAGVIVPLVDNAAGAERAVAAAKYPPRGVRGFGFARANNYGADFDSYARTANTRTIVVTQVESRAAVDNIEAILAVDGIDGTFVGPYDLSASYGVVGQTAHPLVVEACRRVADACRSAGKAAGIHLVLPTQAAARKVIEDGFSMIALGVDAVFLREGGRAALDAALAGVRESGRL